MLTKIFDRPSYAANCKLFRRQHGFPLYNICKTKSVCQTFFLNLCRPFLACRRGYKVHKKCKFRYYLITLCISHIIILFPIHFPISHTACEGIGEKARCETMDSNHIRADIFVIDASGSFVQTLKKHQQQPTMLGNMKSICS